MISVSQLFDPLCHKSHSCLNTSSDKSSDVRCSHDTGCVVGLAPAPRESLAGDNTGPGHGLGQGAPVSVTDDTTCCCFEAVTDNNRYSFNCACLIQSCK